jgi:hypothetical protein
VAGKITKIAAMGLAKSLGKRRFWKKMAVGVLTPHKAILIVAAAHNRDLQSPANGSAQLPENAT